MTGNVFFPVGTSPRIIEEFYGDLLNVFGNTLPPEAPEALRLGANEITALEVPVQAVRQSADGRTGFIPSAGALSETPQA